MCAGHYLAGAVYIVVVAVDLNQTRVGLYPVYIVIQYAVLFHDAVLEIGIRWIYRFRISTRNNHSAKFIKVIESRRNSGIIWIGDPMTRILNRS